MELFLYAKLNCLKYNYFDFETVLTQNLIAWNRIFWHWALSKEKLFLYEAELFELELFD